MPWILVVVLGLFSLLVVGVTMRRILLNNTVKHLQCPLCQYTFQEGSQDTIWHRFVGHKDGRIVVQCGQCLQTFMVAPEAKTAGPKD